MQSARPWVGRRYGGREPETGVLVVPPYPAADCERGRSFGVGVPLCLGAAVLGAVLLLVLLPAAVLVAGLLLVLLLAVLASACLLVLLAVFRLVLIAGLLLAVLRSAAACVRVVVGRLRVAPALAAGPFAVTGGGRRCAGVVV